MKVKIARMNKKDKLSGHQGQFNEAKAEAKLFLNTRNELFISYLSHNEKLELFY